METKDMVSSCSDFEEKEMQQLHKKARIMKESCINGFRALQLNFKLLSKEDLSSLFEVGFKRAFIQFFGEETAFTVLNTPFEKFFNSELIKSSNFDTTYPREHFKKYTRVEAQFFKDTMIQDMDFIEKYMIETILHEREIDKKDE
ncbi:hypothetical protein Tco_0281802 [Tanacetum coccineum]